MRRQATLWLLDLAASDDAALALGLESLGASVRQRYRRFRRPERQRQFLAGRLLLRRALAEASPGISPADIQFTERPGLPPQLGMPGAQPFFSISHAGSWVACAVSLSTPLGLDVELHSRQRDFAALAAHSFDAATARTIAALPEGQRAPAFYLEWCRLEAAYKLGQPALHWAHPPHPELTIAIASAEPIALTVKRA
jgi:4'-phosphopantetheinyl transferase